MSLLGLVPKEQRPRALLIAAIEMLAANAVTFGDGNDETFSADDQRDMLAAFLTDCVDEGIIRNWRRILNRFEIAKLSDPPFRWEGKAPAKEATTS